MLGTETLDALAHTKVAVFGLGGVGSWCAESLVRSGIGKLLLVDSDRVCITNVNRQLMATTKTAGQVKVDVLARRLKEINPLVELDVRQQIYSPETAGEFALDEYDYVVDAIDSLREKAALIRHALSIPTVTLFASMGAALKMDPFQIRATEFRKVEGDGLARALRTKFKKTGGMPARKFKCVWSPERRENLGPAGATGGMPTRKFKCVWSPERRENLGPAGAGCGLGECVCPKDPGVGESSLATHEWCSSKARINGTIAHTTAIFGFALAGLVIQDVEQKIV